MCVPSRKKGVPYLGTDPFFRSFFGVRRAPYRPRLTTTQPTRRASFTHHPHSARRTQINGSNARCVTIVAAAQLSLA